jgi:predicted PurR-regulated permease PerM
MYYRGKFLRFILMITPAEDHEKVNKITTQVSQVTQQYLSGVIIVVVILAVLNSIGLLIIGIKQAIFSGAWLAYLTSFPILGC